jgi:hypothetical protein
MASRASSNSGRDGDTSVVVELDIAHLRGVAALMPPPSRWSL